MNITEKLALLTEWQATVEAQESALEALDTALGYSDGPLRQSCHRMQERYTRAIATILGDDIWLEWFCYENDMGKRGHPAGHEGNLKPIRTLQDLIGLIDNEVTE